VDFAQYLVFAFLGGVILNVMPCVLPVLTLKAFHVVDAMRSHPEEARIHGVAYAVGTTVVFGLFGAIVVALRASGESLGWGMQFQHPEFVAAIVIALYLFGLNALGVFEITFGVRTGGQPRKGLAGSVGNGMLAAVMSMPCTAPFLGTAAAFAMGSDATAAQTLALFTAIALGLAAPFTVLSFVPALIKLLPRPGPWMETFKQVMGFTLIGAAVWFFQSLQAQLTPKSANRVLMFMLVLTVALWAIQRFGTVMHGARRRWWVRGSALAVAVLFWARFVELERPPPRAYAALRAPAQADPAQQQNGRLVLWRESGPAARAAPPVVEGEIAWVPFDPARVEAATRRDQPILLDFTADWCGACKALEATVLDTTPIHEKLEAYGVLPMQADYTNADATMTDWIEAAGRSGIPLVMVIDAEGEKHLMPQVFGVSELEAALDAHAGQRS
jgi:thiol:disulfide interchange protein DsbD